ncbi:MAG TPA: GntR family transcriptional regulator [Edaphobacter sp.]
MESGFVFSQTDKNPMYQQIMEQIKQRIAVGDWPPNTPLPSVREMAIEIKVSVITVKRAYLELGREGVIVTQQGKGSWVNDTLDLKMLQRDELIQHLVQAGKLAKFLAIPEEKMLQMLKQYME